MKKVLITGCSGFLGKYLIDYLLKYDYKVIGLTDVTFIHEDITVYQCDIRDQKEVDEIFKKEKPDVIFHLAAMASVGFSWINQRKTYEVNILGSLSVFEAVLKHCPESRILCMSSAELYGKKDFLTPENAEVEIRHPYALSKYTMEMIGDLFIKSYQLNIVKLRSFNFSGPGQSSDFVISDFARQVAEIEKGSVEAQIYVGNLSVQRDFSDVRDIVRYLHVISQKAAMGGIYNLCSGEAFSIRHFLNLLLGFSKTNIEVVVDQKKVRPVDIPVLAGDNSLLRENFGLSPQFGLERMLEDVLNYWRERV